MVEAFGARRLQMFFVGQKVTCVNDRNWPHRSKFGYAPTFPRKGSIYTVRAIAPRIIHGHDEDGLLLAEIVNPPLVFQSADGTRESELAFRESELAFRKSRFRPIRATNIDVFLEMLEPEPAGHLLVEPVLRAHPSVISLAEERRLRESERGAAFRFNMCVPDGIVCVGYRAQEPETAPPTAPERRQRAGWLRTLLGLGKRPRAS
jgi:hypothetical protein